MCIADGLFHSVTNSQLATSKIVPICIKQANCSFMPFVSGKKNVRFATFPSFSGFSQQLSNLEVLPGIWIATLMIIVMFIMPILTNVLRLTSAGWSCYWADADDDACYSVCLTGPGSYWWMLLSFCCRIHCPPSML